MIEDEEIAARVGDAFRSCGLPGHEYEKLTDAEAVAIASEGGCACDPEDEPWAGFGCLRCEALLALGWTVTEKNEWTAPAPMKEGDTIAFEVLGICPEPGCDNRRFGAVHVNGERTGVGHDEPQCERFQSMEATAYLVWTNNVLGAEYGERGPAGDA